MSERNPIDHLHARIERGYRLARDPERRPILASAKQLLEAAAVTGTGVTLNAIQASALHVWLEYHDAAQELGLREARATTGPANVIPFRKPQPSSTGA